MEYNFRDIENKWQERWKDSGVYKVPNDFSKPKYYVLDMFPYPSGAGLHVGHPLGYIASDIFSRYKRLKGFNVLHPMGYDAFGLPAEQYALEHGVHPAESTAKNIATFRSQLEKIGFCFDWSREVNTSNPNYYKWTQWIFLKLFKSWYNRSTNKTEPIEGLINIFEKEGNTNHPIPNSQFQIALAKNIFTSGEWKGFDEKTQQAILMEYRVAYCGYGEVNWCEALGTVLANDEVVNGVSERGGYPVEKKRLRQWYLRITEYADRLLQGLQTVDFSEAMKEMQSNWIGKSVGADIDFKIQAPSLPSPKGKEIEKREWETARSSTYGLLKELAKEHKQNPTDEEKLLWQHLKDHQSGFPIRRQHIIDQYIVDFVCLDKRLTIEVDGGYHSTGEQKQYDKARTKFLQELGFEELRFSNEDIRNNINSVVEQIIQKLNSKPSVRTSFPFGEGRDGASLTVYTTRPDTIFGVDFMVLAPEHELVEMITTENQKAEVEEYIAYVKSRSERERMAEKKISGVFTGANAVHPFNGKPIPIWISEYVLAGYGTGAIMAVPSGDERDHKFAKHFNLPITNIVGDAYTGEEAYASKDLVLENSGFLTGMNYDGASEVVIKELEEKEIGRRKVNFKMRDAAFSRQRYWGEPFPIKWIDGIAYPLEESELPLQLPYVESYKPGPEGEGPLANIPEWTKQHLETNTMPGYAGSSWYFLRYMDPHNEQAFCDKNISSYWNQVDLYVGGTEHAVGHLLYSRMWTKCLFDLGYISFDEPFKKLLNQGMIQGSSRYVYRLDAYESTGLLLKDININIQKPIFVSHKFYNQINFQDCISNICSIIKQKIPDYPYLEQLALKDKVGITNIRVDVNLVDGIELDIQKFRAWKSEYENSIFILEDGSVSFPAGEGGDGAYICGTEVEKMSKSKYNTVNPDNIVEKYGADTFRMYEMFLGPIDQSKPWDTKGIEGVHRFLKKLWRLFYNEETFLVTDENATPEELKILHKTIKKIEEDTERFSFNTAVSAFMVCVNELTDLKCHKKEILEPLLILLTPYAPHISEELYHQLGRSFPFGEGEDGTSILDASYPKLEEKYLVESSKEYPISINGKMRTQIVINLTATQQQVEETVLQNAVIQKWLEGKTPKKIIFVKGKMVNVVV